MEKLVNDTVYFSHDYVVAYTSDYGWFQSYQIVDHLNDGGWMLYKFDMTYWWDELNSVPYTETQGVISWLVIGEWKHNG